MRFPRIFIGTAFRAAAFYMLLFNVAALLLIGFIYVNAQSFVDNSLADSIDFELADFRDTYAHGGVAAVKESIDQVLRSQVTGDALYGLIDISSGKILAGNLPRWPTPGQIHVHGIVDFIVHPSDDPDDDFEARGRVLHLDADHDLLVARDLSLHYSLRQSIADSLIASVVVTTLLGVLGGALASRWLLSRFENFNRTIGNILAGHLDQRVPSRGSGDEFDRLAEHMNRMLDQIARLMQGMREVSDNVAHDLRSPLTRLRSRNELALMQVGDADTRAVLERNLAEIDGLLAVFNALLNIARIEAGLAVADRKPLDLGALAADIWEFYEPAALDKPLTAAFSCPGPVMVTGDRHLLSQALANLIDNAIKYTPPGGHIACQVRLEGGRPTVALADSGPGIPPEAREHVLQRFTRLDESRSIPGNGLGLSLVAAVARLHGADLALADNQPGLRVTLRFPSA